MRYSRGIGHWRCVIPADLRAHFGKRELVRSTGTGDRLRAQSQALQWTIEARDEFARLRAERDRD